MNPYTYAILFTWISSTALGQGPCSADSNITGFSTIASLNNAMSVELARIEAGGTPNDPYTFILCPETVFDASADTLIPLLNGAIQCGTDGASSNMCSFRGGSEQILILDSTVPSYPLSNITFSGITFDEFTSNAAGTGTSINAMAQSTTTATFNDVNWNMFVTNFVVRQELSEGQIPMAVDIQNSVVLDGVSDSTIFNNDGGQLTLSNLTVQGVTAEIFVATSNGGSTTFSDSLVFASTIQTITETTSRGFQEVNGLNINNMLGMSTAFLAQESGTALNVVNTVVQDNQLETAWRGIDVQSGAVAQITQDTTFLSNTGLQFGVIVSGQSSVVTVQDSFFTSNLGLPGTSTPLFSLQFAEMTIERTELTNNTEFAGQALVFFESSMTMSQSCIVDGASEFVVFVDSVSSFVPSENFVDNTVSAFCNAPGDRLFVEDPGSGCFVGGVCEGTCEVLADQAVCRAPQPTASPSTSPTAPTASPSEVPTQAPAPPSAVPSSIPSLTPTIAPSISPTMTNQPQVTAKPTCPGGGFPPGKPHKMKLGPRKSGPGMRMRPIPEDTSYFKHWVTYSTLQQASERVHNVNHTLPPQYNSGHSSYKWTCAPTNKPSKNGHMAPPINSKSSKKKSKRNKKQHGGGGGNKRVKDSRRRRRGASTFSHTADLRQDQTHTSR